MSAFNPFLGPAHSAETNQAFARWMKAVTLSARCDVNEEKYYFRDRAAYLRRLAQDSLEPQVRKPFLKAAADQDALAEKVTREKREQPH